MQTNFAAAIRAQKEAIAAAGTAVDAAAAVAIDREAVNDSREIAVWAAASASEWVGAQPYTTWAALSAVTGAAGDKAVILQDAGTHTDPVTSTAGVANEGLYVWSASPAGWQRLADTQAARAAAWAEGTLPGGAGTKSAKEHATDAAASAAAAANTVAKPIWTGKLNGWPDPFFRAFDPTAATFLGRGRWYQSVGPFGAGWTKVKNGAFDGLALRRTAGYNQTTRSGPTIWLDELGAVSGDTITLYVLVIDPAAAGGTVYCQYQFSQDSPFAAIGGPVLMQNAAGTLAGVVADATPKFMRAEVVVPADATRVQLIPYNFSGATGFDLIAVWAFKGGIAMGPAWPTLTDNYFGLRDAEITNPTPDLRAWLRAEAYTVTSTITYNAFGRPVSPLNIVWPDGKTGVLTITYNTDGTVAGLSATYAGTPARTVTQPTITYSRGVPTTIPAITVS